MIVMTFILVRIETFELNLSNNFFNVNSSRRDTGISLQEIEFKFQLLFHHFMIISLWVQYLYVLFCLSIFKVRRKKKIRSKICIT